MSLLLCSASGDEVHPVPGPLPKTLTLLTPTSSYCKVTNKMLECFWEDTSTLLEKQFILGKDDGGDKGDSDGLLYEVIKVRLTRGGGKVFNVQFEGWVRGNGEDAQAKHICRSLRWWDSNARNLMVLGWWGQQYEHWYDAFEMLISPQRWTWSCYPPYLFCLLFYLYRNFQIIMAYTWSLWKLSGLIGRGSVVH